MYQIKKKSIYLLFILGIFISCSDSEHRNKISYQDTIQLLNLSLGGQHFDDLLKEALIGGRTVYIALDTADGRWPDQSGKIQIKTIKDYYKTPEYDNPFTESRVVIEAPIFTFNNDTAKVSIHIIKFHMSKEYLFEKDKKKWALISHKEHQY